MDRSDDSRYVKWAKVVKVAGNFRCEICLRDRVYLHSHHKYSWSAYPQKRYDLKNGACLCQRCHEIFHQRYGTNCTEFDFNEFKEIMTIFRNILQRQVEPPK